MIILLCTAHAAGASENETYIDYAVGTLAQSDSHTALESFSAYMPSVIISSSMLYRYNEAVKAAQILAEEAAAANTIPEEKEGLADLKEQITSYINTRAGEWGVYVKNLNTNEYLSINEKSYSSASLIKLFTLASVYNELEYGSVTRSAEVDNLLNLMITQSSNAAFNALTEIIGGGSTVNGFDVENANTCALGCVNTQHKSQLVDKAGESAIFVGYNLTSPADCGNILEMIYRGTLVSETASEEMLSLLKAQTRTWKIPSALPEGTVTANKTGENSKVEGDAAIVYSPACDYILCVIGNGDVGAGTETIRNVSSSVYSYFNN